MIIHACPLTSRKIAGLTPHPPQDLTGVSHFVHRQRHQPLRGGYAFKSAYKTQSHRGAHMFAAERAMLYQAVTNLNVFSLQTVNYTPAPGPHGKSTCTKVNNADSLTGKMCIVKLRGPSVSPACCVRACDLKKIEELSLCNGSSDLL